MEKILLVVFIILFIWNIIIIIIQNKKYKNDLPEKIKVFNLGSSHVTLHMIIWKREVCKFGEFHKHYIMIILCLIIYMIE